MPDLADELALMWARLRERRFSLQDGSLLKDSSSRRNSLGAAMTLIGEQMTAAGVVSSATRPINLYYALVQAGLAITATHTPGTYSFSSHGLKITNPDADLAEITVNVDVKRDRGGYELVSKAVGSEVIESGVPVGALWATLPDLSFTPLPGSEHPKAITVIPNIPIEEPEHEAGAVGFNVIGSLYDTIPHGSIFVAPDLVPEQPSDTWVRELLADYPGTDDCVLYAKDYFRPFNFSVGAARCTVGRHWVASRGWRKADKEGSARLLRVASPPPTGTEQIVTCAPRSKEAARSRRLRL